MRKPNPHQALKLVKIVLCQSPFVIYQLDIQHSFDTTDKLSDHGSLGYDNVQRQNKYYPDYNMHKPV